METEQLIETEQQTELEQQAEAARSVETAKTVEVTQKKKGISGSALKIIALVSMLIDHIGAVVLVRLMMARGYMEIAYSTDVNVINAWLMENYVLYNSYTVIRAIGRLAFPIYCFLLVEGFMKTRDVRKYALRLGVFALLSEIPFDLATKSVMLEFSYQNVFFTLFIGLLTMIVCNWIEKRDWNPWGIRILRVPVIAAGAVLAEFLSTDYGAIGVICIMLLYLFRMSRRWQVGIGAVAFLWEITASLAFIPIRMYNGERGLKLKYIFYAFYPLHLLILYLVCVVMGIAGYPAS